MLYVYLISVHGLTVYFRSFCVCEYSMCLLSTQPQAQKRKKHEHIESWWMYSIYFNQQQMEIKMQAKPLARTVHM